MRHTISDRSITELSEGHLSELALRGVSHESLDNAEVLRLQVQLLQLELFKVRQVIQALQLLHPEANDPELFQSPVSFVQSVREKQRDKSGALPSATELHERNHQQKLAGLPASGNHRPLPAAKDTTALSKKVNGKAGTVVPHCAIEGRCASGHPPPSTNKNGTLAKPTSAPRVCSNGVTPCSNPTNPVGSTDPSCPRISPQALPASDREADGSEPANGPTLGRLSTRTPRKSPLQERTPLQQDPPGQSRGPASTRQEHVGAPTQSVLSPTCSVASSRAGCTPLADAQPATPDPSKGTKRPAPGNQYAGFATNTHTQAMSPTTPRQVLPDSPPDAHGAQHTPKPPATKPAPTKPLRDCVAPISPNSTSRHTCDADARDSCPSHAPPNDAAAQAPAHEAGSCSPALSDVVLSSWPQHRRRMHARNAGRQDCDAQKPSEVEANSACAASNRDSTDSRHTPQASAFNPRRNPRHTAGDPAAQESASTGPTPPLSGRCLQGSLNPAPAAAAAASPSNPCERGRHWTACSHVELSAQASDRAASSCADALLDCMATVLFTREVGADADDESEVSDSNVDVAPSGTPAHPPGGHALDHTSQPTPPPPPADTAADPAEPLSNAPGDAPGPIATPVTGATPAAASSADAASPRCLGHGASHGPLALPDALRNAPGSRAAAAGTPEVHAASLQQQSANNVGRMPCEAGDANATRPHGPPAGATAAAAEEQTGNGGAAVERAHHTTAPGPALLVVEDLLIPSTQAEAADAPGRAATVQCHAACDGKLSAPRPPISLSLTGRGRSPHPVELGGMSDAAAHGSRVEHSATPVPAQDGVGPRGRSPYSPKRSRWGLKPMPETRQEPYARHGNDIGGIRGVGRQHNGAVFPMDAFAWRGFPGDMPEVRPFWKPWGANPQAWNSRFAARPCSPRGHHGGRHGPRARHCRGPTPPRRPQAMHAARDAGWDGDRGHPQMNGHGDSPQRARTPGGRRRISREGVRGPDRAAIWPRPNSRERSRDRRKRPWREGPRSLSRESAGGRGLKVRRGFEGRPVGWR